MSGKSVSISRQLSPSSVLLNKPASLAYTVGLAGSNVAQRTSELPNAVGAHFFPPLLLMNIFAAAAPRSLAGFLGLTDKKVKKPASLKRPLSRSIQFPPSVILNNP